MGLSTSGIDALSTGFELNLGRLTGRSDGDRRGPASAFVAAREVSEGEATSESELEDGAGCTHRLVLTVPALCLTTNWAWALLSEAKTNAMPLWSTTAGCPCATIS